MPCSIKSGEYLFKISKRASVFSVSITSVAFPNTITLSYFVLNLSGNVAVCPTTQKDTLSLTIILSNLEPSLALWKYKELFI